MEYLLQLIDRSIIYLPSKKIGYFDGVFDSWSKILSTRCGIPQPTSCHIRSWSYYVSTVR